MDRVGADLMCQLLQLDPSRRPTAAKALEHPWFTVNPLPAKIGSIPVVESSHEMTSRDRNMPVQPPQPARAPAWSQPVRPPPPAHHPHGRQMHHRPPAYRPPPPNSLPSAPAYPSPVSTGMGRGFAPAPPFGLAGNRRGGGPGGPGGPMRPHGGHGPGPGGPGGFGGPPGGGLRLAGGIRPSHGPSFGGPRPPKRPGDEHWGGRPDKRPRNDGALPY